MSETPAFRRHARVPKVKPGRRRTAFIPALPQAELGWIFAPLVPAERRALDEIVQRGDLVDVEGCVYIIAPVSAKTIDALAAFGAEGEDREPDLEDEPGTDEEAAPWIEDHKGRLGCGISSEDCEIGEDDEPDHDNEPDEYRG
jgi:hypothetical protein